jgi:DNA-binding HxlR family transcriptional regulator
MDALAPVTLIDPPHSVMDATCAARQVLDLIADKWAVLVIYALSDGTKRYNTLHRLIGGITNKMLTQTLRRLEEQGIVHREVYPEIPPRVEYSLTPLGMSLSGLVSQLIDWAENNLCALPAPKR